MNNAWDSLSGIAQLITAIVLALNCLQSWRNGQRAKEIAAETAVIASETAAIAVKTEAIADTMQVLEKNTNSKMDNLLALTAKASKAEGLQQGREENK
jgi:hypothetical protein